MDDKVQDALNKYEKSKSAWSRIYQHAREDLEFLSDEPLSQWDEQDAQARMQSGRPVLQTDQVAQFVHQVVNDIRMNTPIIEPIPAGHGSSKLMAELYKGLIKNIEYDSRADVVYDTAVENSVKCSVGWMRVDHEYFDDETFDQKLVLNRICNPLSVIFDPESVEIDGRDAKCAFVLEQMSVDAFKKDYPDKEPRSIEAADVKAELSDDDMITIAEYFYIEEEKQQITDETGEKKREVTKREVRRVKISGADVLEETKFPGKYIPIVPVYGEEHWNGGQRELFSLVRRAKDPARMYHMWESLIMEALMKQPTAPIIAATNTFEDYKDFYLNPHKAAVLPYHPVDAFNNPVAPPQRLAPPDIPLGFVQASQTAVENIKASMGIYNSGLGQMDNSLSGVAIGKRTAESDVATFHYLDNLVKSIEQVGRILLSAIPEVYDTPRIVGVIDAQENSKLIGINGALVEGQLKSVYIEDGKYDVKVTTGAAFTTQRQEAAEFFRTLIQSQPQMMEVMGDLMFDNMDFAGATAMSERMRKLIDPKLLGEEGQDPQVMQLSQQLEQSQAIISALQAELSNKQQEYNLKAQENKSDAQADRAKIEMQLIELRIKEQMQLRELALKEREIAIKEAELQVKAVQSTAPIMAGSFQEERV